ncbi:MAG: hypothetical protein RIB65_13100 [Ilumatobacter fluminis]|uniref:GHMP family kinase ATP-binding protein n=1 Tax=Ilumatobacter fluminis TaxID=467091 RepID=UPI0032EE1B89
MTTGRSIVSSCAAHAVLAGNPSERYGGAITAVSLPDLTAMAALRESATGRFAHRGTDPAQRALVDAAVAAITERRGEVPPVELSLSTNIPDGVGLGRSAALAIATLRALRAFDGDEHWDAADLAATAFDVVGARLGADVSLAEFAVPAHGGAVAATFESDTTDTIDTIDAPDDLPLFVAWSHDDSTAIGRSTDAAPRTANRSLRRRFDGGDATVTAAMSELRVQAGRARRGLIDGDLKLVADAVHRTLGVRLGVSELTPTERRLVEVGRTAGAAVNVTGSGRSIVGLARHPEHLEIVEAAYETAGLRMLTPS